MCWSYTRCVVYETVCTNILVFHRLRFLSLLESVDNRNTLPLRLHFLKVRRAIRAMEKYEKSQEEPGKLRQLVFTVIGELKREKILPFFSILPTIYFVTD